jgi:hypothetical protein
MKKTAFIIGSGPSLNKIDVGKLRDYPTIAFNRSYIAYEDWGFYPTNWACADHSTLSGMVEDVKELISESSINRFWVKRYSSYADQPDTEPSDTQNHDCYDWFKDTVHYVWGNHVEKGGEWIQRNFYHPLSDLAPYSLKIFDKNKYSINTDSLPTTMNFLGLTEGFRDRDNLPPIYLSPYVHNDIKTDIVMPGDAPPNSGMFGLSILKFLGYNEIAFVGMDARYKNDKEYRDIDEDREFSYIGSSDDDQNHFRPDYFGKDAIFGKPNESQIIEVWGTAAPWIEAMKDFNVYSCTPDSNLNPYYEYIPFEEFLKGKREGEKPTDPIVNKVINMKKELVI